MFELEQEGKEEKITFDERNLIISASYRHSQRWFEWKAGADRDENIELVLPLRGLLSYQWLLYFSSRTMMRDPRNECSWVSLSKLACWRTRNKFICNSIRFSNQRTRDRGRRRIIAYHKVGCGINFNFHGDASCFNSFFLDELDCVSRTLFLLSLRTNTKKCFKDERSWVLYFLFPNPNLMIAFLALFAILTSYNHW